MNVIGDAEDPLDAVTAAQEALGSPVLHHSEHGRGLEEIWVQLDELSAEMLDSNGGDE